VWTVCASGRQCHHADRGVPCRSQADLSYSDRRFDGDSFLAAARRAGGVGALVRRLLHDGAASRRFTHSPRRRSRQAVAGAGTPAAGGVDRLSLAAAQAPLGPVPEGLLQGLAGVTLRAMLTGAALAAGEVAQRNEIAVPGWLLGLFGLGDASEEQFAEIRRLLTGLSAQVTRLQSDVNLAGFSALVHQTDRTTGVIHGPTAGRRWEASAARKQLHEAAATAGCETPVRAAPTAARPRGRDGARRRSAGCDPASTRPLCG
jgi:hypothetical protein